MPTFLLNKWVLLGAALLSSYLAGYANAVISHNETQALAAVRRELALTQRSFASAEAARLSLAERQSSLKKSLLAVGDGSCSLSEESVEQLNRIQ